MGERREQVSAASEELLKKIADMRATEDEKRQHEISSPEFHGLAEEVTRKSWDLMRTAHLEEAIGDETERTGDSIEDALDETREAEKSGR